METKKKSVEQRLLELEEFRDRVKLGQKWALCILAGIGSVVAFVSYTLTSLNQLDIWKTSHGG